MKIAIYSTETGAILRRGNCPPDHAALQCKEGEEFFLNCPDESTHIIDGAPVALVVVPSAADKLAAIRTERNRRLFATDWRVLPDAPGDTKAWRLYRQQLRDFPATCNTDNPVWPTPPKGA